ncbi:MAG: thymidine phosphorylase, partial [Candidatus Enteromonas sp.]
MRMVDIIETKRDGKALSREEIFFFVNGYAKGEIPDYQASALAMAIVFQGMEMREIADLTDAMMHSGETIDLSDIPGVKVDKHSTGGVGDKTSLVLGPLVAACGAKLAKMSGRGLGHTGGTLDKMESVPGMRIGLSEEEFKNQVRRIGIAIAGQTADIDPADKKLYALRDVTGTVNSIPLIASSIMSKKLASGADTILLDVKFGSGAFMKTIEDAERLAKTMVQIGDALHRDTRAILTDMEQPLGFAVGNSLEVKEAIATLQGHGPKDLVELVENAGGIMLEQAHLVSDLESGKKRIAEAIADGGGFHKLVELFEAQGGDVSYLKNPSLFPVAQYAHPVLAEKEGY